MCTRDEVADDVTYKLWKRFRDDSEAFIQLTDGCFTRYVNCAVKNNAIDHRRVAERRSDLKADLQVEAETYDPARAASVPLHLSERSRPDRLLNFRNYSKIVEQTMQKLSAKRQKVLILLLDGASHKKIAAELGLGIKTVGAEIRRAQKDMWRLMPEDAMPPAEHLLWPNY